jgi:predicted amidophosphoribosyltransferase
MSASRAAARNSTLTGRGALRDIKVHWFRAIILLKFEEMEPLADWFADGLVEVVRENGQILDADMIVPVPSYKIRRRERGFNQAELAVKTTRQTAQTAASGHFIGALGGGSWCFCHTSRQPS